MTSLASSSSTPRLRRRQSLDTAEFEATLERLDLREKELRRLKVAEDPPHRSNDLLLSELTTIKNEIDTFARRKQKQLRRVGTPSPPVWKTPSSRAQARSRGSDEAAAEELRVATDLTAASPAQRRSPPLSGTGKGGASFSAFLDSRLRQIEQKYHSRSEDDSMSKGRYENVRDRYLQSFQEQLRNERSRRSVQSSAADPPSRAVGGIHNVFAAHMQERLATALDDAVTERASSVRGLTRACLEDIENSAEELNSALRHDLDSELTTLRQRALTDKQNLLLDVRRECERERREVLERTSQELQTSLAESASKLRTELRAQTEAEVEDLHTAATKRLVDEKRKLSERAAERRAELDARLEAEHSEEAHAAELGRWRKELEAEVAEHAARVARDHTRSLQEQMEIAARQMLAEKEKELSVELEGIKLSVAEEQERTLKALADALDAGRNEAVIELRSSLEKEGEQRKAAVVEESTKRIENEKENIRSEAEEHLVRRLREAEIELKSKADTLEATIRNEFEARYAKSVAELTEGYHASKETSNAALRAELQLEGERSLSDLRATLERDRMTSEAAIRSEVRTRISRIMSEERDRLVRETEHQLARIRSELSDAASGVRRELQLITSVEAVPSLDTEPWTAPNVRDGASARAIDRFLTAIVEDHAELGRRVQRLSHRLGEVGQELIQTRRELAFLEDGKRRPATGEDANELEASRRTVNKLFKANRGLLDRVEEMERSLIDT